MFNLESSNKEVSVVLKDTLLQLCVDKVGLFEVNLLVQNLQVFFNRRVEVAREHSGTGVDQRGVKGAQVVQHFLFCLGAPSRFCILAGGHQVELNA